MTQIRDDSTFTSNSVTKTAQMIIYIFFNHFGTLTLLVITRHMSEFPEPQKESASVFENRDIGLFRKGPKLMFFNFVLCIFRKSKVGSTQKIILDISFMK